jgi:hypothetical protein
MILKYRDNDNNWNWIDEIRHFKKLSDGESVELELTFQNGIVGNYSIDAQEAYICSDSTGSTIDVIKSLAQ